MNVSIRKSKHQQADLSSNQIDFATRCILMYLGDRNETYFDYEGSMKGDRLSCAVYKTKKTISAVVSFVNTES